MRLMSRMLVFVCFIHCAMPSFSAGGGAFSMPRQPFNSGPGTNPAGGQEVQRQDAQNKLITYILNLGLYLGYNLKKDPSEENKSGEEVNQRLLSSTQEIIKQKDQLFQALVNTLVGSIPVDTAGFKSFVPENSTYKSINDLANSTFKNPPYSTASETGVSISPLIDQPTYQGDPVSQAVLNILTTPSYTYCLNNEQTEWEECKYLRTNPQIINREKAMINVLGNGVPDMDTYWSFKYNQSILSQVNSESLLAPLLYTSTSEGGAGTSSDDSFKTQSPALTAKTQTAKATNFVRYLTSSVSPMALIERKQYSYLYDMIFDKRNSELTRFKAQASLSEYILAVRIYAAQASVAIGNLYWILSKRLPQKVNSQGDTPPTSQALSEFTMATWRLFKPGTEGGQLTANKAWADQLNTASAATVQKEIAVLLAEINYQLYLNRQQQERMLLTESVLTLQNLRSMRPKPGSVGF